MTKRILLVEDDTIQSANIAAYLARQGWEVRTCSSAEEALRAYGEQRPDCVVADQTLPRLSGIEMVAKMRFMDPSVNCVMMTGDDRAQTAVGAMKAGACDYMVKPIVMAELHRMLERAMGEARLEHAHQFEGAVPMQLQRQPRGASVQSLVGESLPMEELKGKIDQVLEAERRVQDGDLPAVLIVGETGTGKELVARALHFDGRRKSGPFVEVNCASIPSQLLEAELFGHEKGAFTDAKERRAGLVEAADGGTLFLDEIGEVDLALQAKLLKLLEDRTVRRVGSSKECKVDLRIISATNRDLASMVREGTFRSDLFFRLRIISIELPTLRFRGGEDILLLARHFLEFQGRRYGKPGLKFTDSALQMLMQYSWPGNVRELRNVLEQTALMAHDDAVTPANLALSPALEAESVMRRAPGWGVAQPISVARQEHSRVHAEDTLLVRTLEQTGWNVTRSAKLLGLTRDVLRYRIDKMGLSRPADVA